MPTPNLEEPIKTFLPLVHKREQTPPEPTPTRIAIDPITRIEGHLRIEVKIEDGHVTDAWSAGMMFRGIELLLPGRDPRDAWVFTQRICGV
jgi:coenzyme F420-reducing hydrogenase alpha subunit